MSHLQVYDWPAPRGMGTGEMVGSGTPHLHTASSEGYVVLAGSGSVQTLSAQGYGETPLQPGVVVWFTPGVVHRLVNDAGLELLVVMSNAGLPEAGDAVLTFPPEVLADADAYRAAATLPEPELSESEGPDAGADPLTDPVVAVAARRRRDLALAGYAVLRERVEAEGPAALTELWSAAARLVAPRAAGWESIVRAGARAESERTARHLEDLAAAVGPHLADASVASTAARPGPRRYGMCGRLQTWPL